MPDRKPAHLNGHGAFICESCSNGEHLGVRHLGICDCACDGAHDKRGRPINPVARKPK